MKDCKYLFFIGFILFAVISVNNVWANGGKDVNGLRQEDYDANGWYRMPDGKWVKNPNGAIFEEKLEYPKNAGISVSVPVGGSIIAPQQTITGANRFNAETSENPGAHGTAAEWANTIDDILHGRNVRVVGDDNVKNGPDRIVNNIRIQTKYWKTGWESVDDCFVLDSLEKGYFKYVDNNGKLQQIEVPKDQYDVAVRQMEYRIRNGNVQGVSDPAEAKNIVRRGNITYNQSKNIGKAGTIDSLVYDAKTGVITCGFAFGLSATVDYWMAKRNGVPTDLAIQSAIVTGLKIGGIAFASSVLAGQLSKMGFNPLPVSTTISTGAGSGNNIPTPFGHQSFEKLFRGNLIYAVATVAVLTTVDTVNLFRGRISGSQLFKNLLTNSGAAVGAAAGAAAGAKGGAAAGTAIAPGPGTAIGGVVGGLGGGIVGGVIGGAVVHTVAGAFIEDDAVQMVEIIMTQFTHLANSYLITQAEADQAVGELQAKLYIFNSKLLKDMFESSNKLIFARNLITPIFKDIASNRQFVVLPDEDQIAYALNVVLAEVVE
jgi:hypothetical protein